MQHFQPILIVIGVLAIAAVLIHGYLLSRKNKVSQPNHLDTESTSSQQDDSDAPENLDLYNHIDENNDPHLLHIEDNLEAEDFVINTLAVENDLHSIKLNNDDLTETDSEENHDLDIESLPKATDQAHNLDESTQQPYLKEDNVKQEVQSAATTEDIFIFNVVAKEEGYLRGHTLLQFFLTAGFRFGNMNIFHRHLHSDGTGPILFSIANMMAPGVFNPTKMKQFHSEGVSFFLTAPNDEINIKEAFDMMLVAVQQMADEFDCVVLNADREPMTEEQFREYHKRLLRYI